MRWIQFATLLLPIFCWAPPAAAQSEGPLSTVPQPSVPQPSPPSPTGISPLGNNVPSWLQRWSRVNQRSSTLVKSIFREVIEDARDCTVRITSDGKLTALGAVVAPTGFILTKASEIEGDIACTLSNGKEYRAIVVGVRDDYDLAMLKIAVTDLPVVAWSTDPEPVPGSWLATPGGESIPIAIGVVSASSRKIAPHQGVLGILLAPSESGSKVTHVLPGSSAALAGIRVGDIVIRVNNRTVAEPPDLMAKLQHVKPGEQVTLQILRAKDPLQIIATLGTADVTEEARRTKLQQGLGRRLSKRNAGFPVALQHDSVLRPRDCGGPLVNLDGRVVGLNIASADRVTSYAIPTREILPLLPDLMSGKLAPAESRTQWQTFLSQATQIQASLDKQQQHLKQLREILSLPKAAGGINQAANGQTQDGGAVPLSATQSREQYEQLRTEISKVESGLVQLRQELASLPTTGFQLSTP